MLGSDIVGSDCSVFVRRLVLRTEDLKIYEDKESKELRR